MQKTIKESDMSFSVWDYVKTPETLFRTEWFWKVLNKNGDSYECLMSFIEWNSTLWRKPLKIHTGNEFIKPESLTKITETDYQNGILIQKGKMAHHHKLKKYWQDSKHNIELLSKIIKKEHSGSGDFKDYFKEVILIHYDEIFSFEKLNPSQQQEVMNKSMQSWLYMHERNAKIITLTQQYILSAISKQLKADEIKVIKDICIEKQNNQIEFCKWINEWLEVFNYTYQKWFIITILGIIVILMIPVFAPHFKIWSFIFWPLFIWKGLYIVYKTYSMKQKK